MSLAKQLSNTYIMCTIFLFLTYPLHGGVALLLIVPCTVIWALVKLIGVFRGKVAGKFLAIQLVLLAITLTIPSIAHWHRQNASRSDADFLVGEIKRHKAKSGVFPRSLDEIGIDEKKYRNEWRISYMSDGDKPFLFYMSTFAMFDSYSYDFEKNAWVYHGD